MKKNALPAVLLALALCACSADVTVASTAEGTAGTTGAVMGTAEANPDASLYSDRDWNPSYDTSTATVITGSGAEAAVQGGGAVAEGGVVTITQAGTYLLSGDWQGQVVVNVSKQDKVQLVLDGLTLQSADGPAIWVQCADKVFLTLAEDSVNTLADSTTYTEQQDEEPNAAVFCDADLTIQGSGALTVTGNFDHAVRCKDDLTVTGGVLALEAVGKGLKAKKTLAVGGGTITVTRSEEALEANTIAITGGLLDLTATDDGINASSPTNWTGDAPSLTISGGTVLVSAEGDGLDSNGSLTMAGGVLLIAGPTTGADSALDYETTAVITGGMVVAVGSVGMAENFGAGSTQGSWLAATGSQAAGTALTLLDADGNVLLHWTPGKQYETAVLSTPGLVQGGSYTLLCGATVAGADENGFACTGAAEGGTQVAETTLETLVQSEAGMGAMGGMGGFGPGGMGDPQQGGGFQGGMGGGRQPMEGMDGTPPELPEGMDGQQMERPEGMDGQQMEPPEGFGGPGGEPPAGNP